MRLKRITKELIDRKFGTQIALAERLNPMPDGISPCKPQDIQRLAGAGRNMEKQFAMFMKLVPFWIEMGLIQARELLPLPRHADTKPDMDDSPPRPIKTGTRRR